MQILKPLYRANYAGENIVTQLNLSGGEWNPETEFVPNGVINTHTTNQAVVLGNGTSRLAFDLAHIRRHKGGLLGVNRLQSYGCNALYRDFAPDFLITNGDAIVKEIANSGYTKEHIVYAHADAVLKYPGQFYLIPQNIHLDAGALAAYMAAFDGHTKVFLLGFDGYDVPMQVDNVYTGTACYPLPNEIHNGEFLGRSLTNVVKAYGDVEFIRVMPRATWNMYYSLKSLPNFRQINYRDFVLEADVG
jgi:hypothetical protein